MPFDRGQKSSARARKQMQKFASGAAFIFGDGLVFDGETGQVSIGIATDPALEFVAGELQLLLKPSGGLLKDSTGLQIDLDSNPGLVLGSGGIKILVDPAGALTLSAAGIKVATAAASGTAITGNVLTIDLRDTDPGLTLAATGLGILLGATPGLTNTGGLSVVLNGTTLTLGASGLSVTAPEGFVSVTSVKTGTYTAAIGELVRCDPSAAGFTVNLPTAAGNTGRRIIVKNTTSSTNAITVDGNAAETIDGAATQTINTAFGRLTVVSDGTNWMVV